MPLNTEPYSGWGRVLTADGGRARPERASALARALAETPGPAIGALRSYGDAPLNSAGPAIDMSRLNRLMAFDAETGIVEAEAGVTIRDLLDVFAPRGWMPAVMPGTGHVTIGGAIAADVHGKNHGTAGSFGAHIASLRLLGPDGGAREVTPETEPDLFRATVGGMGLTGVIESARLRLAPCPAVQMDVREQRIANLDAYLAAFEDSTATFSVGWIDATAANAALGRGILEEAEFATPAAAVAKARDKRRAVPLDAPRFALSGPVVRAFNTAWFRRVPAGGRHRTRPLASFFFPLDSIAAWNRLYGKRGFYQFQCVLPPETATLTLRPMLERIAGAGLAAPLAVLKKLGPGRAGMMSFPMAGYTLAVDFPNRDAARTLIGQLNAMTAEAGGRVYLAKDALATPRQIEEMYPELPAFRTTVAAADPDGTFATDLSRRLELRP